MQIQPSESWLPCVQVSEIDNAVRVNVPLKRKAVIRKKKEPEPEDEPVHEAGTEEAPAEGSEHSPGDEDAEEDGFTQVYTVFLFLC